MNADLYFSLCADRRSPLFSLMQSLNSHFTSYCLLVQVLLDKWSTIQGYLALSYWILLQPANSTFYSESAHRLVLVHVRSPDDAFLLLYMEAGDVAVQRIAEQGLALQAKHIEVPASVRQVLALLRALHQFLKSTSAEHGIDGTVRHLHIAKAHDARGYAVTLRHLKLRFSVRSHADDVRAVPQVVYLQL